MLITHNMGVVADLADRVVVMYQGDVVEQADRRPCSPTRSTTTPALLAAVPSPRPGHPAKASGRRATDGEPKPVVEAEASEIEYPGGWARRLQGRRRRHLQHPTRRGLGLVGESGSGKTTIGRAIAGLTKVPPAAR